MTSVAPSGPGSPVAAPPPSLRSPRPPLIGVIAGVVFAAGLGLWTMRRIGEAKTGQADVAARRSAERERTASLAGQPLQVSVVRGSADRWQPRVELDGSLEAVHEAQLGFKVGGRLARVTVKVGDRVAAGALLAVLDDSEAVAQVAAAEAQARAAESSLTLAQDAERRMLPLVKNGSVPEANGVQASEQRQLAAAQLDAARAQHALARASLGNHTLKAPFSGTITQAPTGIGAVVGPGQALLALVDTTALKLATTVSEEDANLLERGAEVHLNAGAAEVKGRVSAVLATLDARTRRVPVVVDFDNRSAAGPTLRAGAFVRGWVMARQPISVLRVPHAVQRIDSRDEVWVVNAASRLEPRRIAFAIAPDGDLLVRSGLTSSDPIVLAPIPELETGDVVQAAAPPAPRAPSDTATPPTPSTVQP
ncbi:MAG: efflux RND transporter periplasmic adaptor subunit [Deltaproteobacteria bacterium]